LTTRKFVVLSHGRHVRRSSDPRGESPDIGGRARRERPGDGGVRRRDTYSS
jgi:hypothetical protein